MKTEPLKDEALCPPGKLPSHGAGLDIRCNMISPIDGMEMRRKMVTREDAYDYAKESRYLGHFRILPMHSMTVNGESDMTGLPLGCHAGAGIMPLIRAVVLATIELSIASDRGPDPELVIGMSRDEFAFIDWLRERGRAPRTHGSSSASADDMAGVRWPSGLVLITCDIRLDTVHFVWDQHGPELVGRKGGRLQPERLRAMAALPRAAVISVALNKNVSMDEAKRLAGSMIDTAKAYAARSSGVIRPPGRGRPPSTFTMLGEVPDKRQPILRSGAKPAMRYT